MRISLKSKVVKYLCRIVPRHLMATNFSLKQFSKNIFEAAWMLTRQKKVLFLKGLTIEKHLGGRSKCEWLYKAPWQKSKIVFFVHGGSYLSGGISHARGRSMRYALNTSASLFAVSYRTSAISPFPAAFDDVYASYKYLTMYAPNAKIIVIGDSAGGGLALATMQRAIKEGLKLPEKIILNSPWTDLTCSSRSYFERQAKDVILDGNYLHKCARLYCGTYEAVTPSISPLYGDFTGFPPLEVNVGSDEILFDDSSRVVKKARSQGVRAKLTVWPKMFHMFHYFEGILNEADAVCREIYKSIEET